MAETPLVGIIMGSKSDMPTMEACTKELEELGVPYELV
ncbi:MAG: AIR carboxylase family protein, partial [Olsenella sp.]